MRFAPMSFIPFIPFILAKKFLTGQTIQSILAGWAS